MEQRVHSVEKRYGIGAKYPPPPGLSLMSPLLRQIIMFYFSGHFCPPCRSFTPLLSKFYKRHAASKQLEVVFVSNDKDEAEFNAYFASM